MDRYEEALERAKAFNKRWKNVHATDSELALKELKEIFPELAESDDEKIRKSLLEYLHTLPNHYSHSGVCAPEWIAWLEKQGTPAKLSEEEQNRFAKGQGEQNLANSAKTCKDEQKPAEDSCKNSDDITTEEIDRTEYKKGFECGKQRVLKYPEDFDLCKKPLTAWSEDDEYLLGETIQHLEDLIRIDKAKHLGIDVQYYQRDIDWLKSLKGRVQPQPKQEWSKKDLEMLSGIELDLTMLMAKNPDYEFKKSYQEEIDWLKSLKLQNRWKPSAFYLECISDAIAMYEERGINAIGLKEILEELKKM